MKAAFHVQRDINKPEDFITYYRDVIKGLILQGQALKIPHSLLGQLTISASIAFLTSFLKDPTKENVMKKFEEAYDLFSNLKGGDDTWKMEK